MKNIILSIIFVLIFTSCKQATQNTTSELNNIKLDFSTEQTQVYDASYRMITKVSETELNGIFKIKIKENELADLIFEFTNNKSRVPVLGEIELNDTTIRVMDMDSAGIFINGNVHPQMLFEALIPLSFNKNSDIILKMPMSGNHTSGDQFLEMKMTFPTFEEDSISEHLRFEGKFSESKTYDEPFEYKVDVSGTGEYVYNQDSLHFDYISLRLNIFTKMLESDMSSFVNHSTTLKYLRTE
ncbi:hypothetical protein E1176_01265 [Fulvivirga sp. RKSG066]|uniref:hypothetical protein n=1 Tax=Fulvivirga aurantia TaxID=2529383 RepID=UPI0012BD5268|nr:hypothetical protein [Fulvivirga aurantia]MTI19641.1 hypothetical protein [Fulvivirga aurantia]